MSTKFWTYWKLNLIYIVKSTVCNFSSTITDLNSNEKIFVTDEITDKMVRETNKYALKYIAEKQNNNEIKTKSWLVSFKATDSIEMQVSGGLLATGLNKVPHINDYW